MKHFTGTGSFLCSAVLLALMLVSVTAVSFAQCQSGGSTCYINSNCCSGMCAQPAPGCHTELCPTAQCLGNSGAVNFKTLNGHFLTAVNDGGVGGPNSGAQSAAIHTDSTTIGPWETFTCAISLPGTVTFQTTGGDFVTAVKGGGIGGPNANPYQLHTDATVAGPWGFCWRSFDSATLRSEFRLRAPAALTPAKRLKITNRSV